MLKIEDYNKGLIYTETKHCIDCNKCIHECPVLSANVSIMDGNGKYSKCVDEKECILCGTCIDTCVHGARHYVDDFEDFLADLKQGKTYSVIIAPSFFLNYPNEYKQMLGYLKSLGVKDFYSASFGADITIWGYLQFMATAEDKGYIAQPCPSIVRHIEKHLPKLLPKLVPIQSPLMCMAIYLKRYLGIKEELVFLSPCIAKKVEIASKRGLGYVKYNTTFKSLMAHIKNEGIDLANQPAFDDNIDHGKGALFPCPGGLRENMEHYMGSRSSVFQVEGEYGAYKYLQYLSDDNSKSVEHIPSLIDILNCDKGCVYGTGTEFRTSSNYRASYEAVIARQKRYATMRVWSQAQKYPSAGRIANINEVFRDLRLKDFMCTYEMDMNVNSTTISESQIEAILIGELDKLDDDDKHVDCSACGYKTCRDMAEAIARGINHHANCIYHVKKALADSVLENQRNAQMLEERLKAMINVSPMLCTIFDEDFNIVDVNRAAAKIFNLPDERDYIRRFVELVPEFQPDGTPSLDIVRASVRKALTTGKDFVPEFMHQNLDGKPIPVEVYVERVVLGNKPVVLVYARDLSELKDMLGKLEDALDRAQSANDAKTKFLSKMSHEIRTPMNSVLGIAELQLQNERLSQEVEDAFARIYSSSNLLLSIINDILDLSKVEAGKMEVIPLPYDTASFIIDTIQLNLMIIGSNMIDFELHVDENLPETLIGDEVRIKQVLNNILSNAFKYTHKGNVRLSISIENALDGTNVVLVFRVSDTGQGMTKEQVDSLFGDEFKRFNLEDNRRIEGSGLGLVIAYQLIQMMGGDISVKSTPEEGSTFTVRLPQKRDGTSVLGPEVTAKLQNLEDTQKSLKKISKFERELMPYGRVLVVDDVEANLFVAKGFLLPYKISIETATCGKQAVNKIEEGNVYDIIFMDHMMPEMDGIEATKAIRRMGYEHPIIALTANAFSDSVQMFMDNGFSGFLSKPIDTVQLNKLLLRFIRDKRSEHRFQSVSPASVSEPGTNDNIDFDDMLVEIYLRDAARAISAFERLMRIEKYDAETLKSYIIQAHGMKGALYTIGNFELSEKASTLEVAGCEGNIEYIKSETPQFLSDMRKFSNKLQNKSIQSESAQSESEDLAYLRSQLSTIKEACISQNVVAAEKAVEALIKKPCSEQTKALLSAVSNHLLYFELDEAAELISHTILN